MHTLLISDLHLSPEKPHVAKAFFTFMQAKAPQAESLYILGDLFEYWIGDDAAELVGAKPALELMKAVSQQTKCYFIAGNRDFLVRDGFEEASGFSILDDETVVNLHGVDTLLLHGDSLCIEDVKHQQFRETMTTNKTFCDQFLQLPIDQRVAKAQEARMESGKHKSEVSMGIMDVTTSAVEDTFEKYGVQRMIHGHTHRQNTHQHGDNVRYVLGDWEKTDSIMTVSEAGISIANHDI